jgi:hypothetical protein
MDHAIDNVSQASNTQPRCHQQPTCYLLLFGAPCVSSALASSTQRWRHRMLSVSIMVILNDSLDDEAGAMQGAKSVTHLQR